MLPAVVYSAAGSILSLNETGSGDHPDALEKPAAVPVAGSKTSLAILTLTALAAMWTPIGSSTAAALGLSYALASAGGILLVERAGGLAQQSRSSVIYSANGFLAQPEDSERPTGNNSADVVRDVCAAAASATLAASFLLESWSFGGLAYHGWAGHSMSGNWASRHGYISFAIAVGVVLIHMLVYYSLLLMVSELVAPNMKVSLGHGSTGRGCDALWSMAPSTFRSLSSTCTSHFANTRTTRRSRDKAHF